MMTTACHLSLPAGAKVFHIHLLAPPFLESDAQIQRCFHDAPLSRTRSPRDKATIMLQSSRLTFSTSNLFPETPERVSIRS